jgi:hypothetical protein
MVATIAAAENRLREEDAPWTTKALNQVAVNPVI